MRLVEQEKCAPNAAANLLILPLDSAAHNATRYAKPWHGNPTRSRGRLVLITVAGFVVAATATAQRGTQSASTKPTPAPVQTDTGLRMGSFVSSRIDGKRLPVVDLATDSLGTQYVIEFAELVMAVKAGGEFRATLRYRQTLALKGRATSQEPLQRMVVFGTWIRDGQTMRFIPDPKRGGQGLRILAGSATSRSITVPFDYQNGRVTKRSTVLLIYDPTIF